jgi:dihydrofolate synthase/folylpolyglutamate synthase
MQYEEAVAYLDSLTDIERMIPADAANRFQLGRVQALLTLLDHPEGRFAAVHIVGTKGKGSTAAMIASALQTSDMRVALYTSPHLHSLRERIRVNGSPIPERSLGAMVTTIQPLIDRVHTEQPGLGRLTTFEVITAVALAYFAGERVDYAVIEAGLGGRLDATNVLRPLVTVIAPISLDHTDYLGNTVAAIAREKAAVIKPGGNVISAAQHPEAQAVIEKCAAQAGARLAFIGREWQWERAGGDQTIVVRGPERQYRDLFVPLLGAHQLENAALAIAALDALRAQGAPLTAEHIRDGIARVRWPGRLEILSHAPLIIVDGAHNPDAMSRLREALSGIFGGQRIILVLGTSADKDLAGIIAAIAPGVAQVIVTRSRHPRSASLDQLLALLTGGAVPVEAVDGVSAAIERACQIAGTDDLICVTGSLFVVAEAREAILGAAAMEV